MRNRHHARLLAGLLLYLMCFILHAEETAKTKPLLHPLFGTNALLQRDMNVPVWGWDKPQSEVILTLSEDKNPDNSLTLKATADESGRWQVQLPPHKQGGSYTLTAKGSSTSTSKNIIFGDLWVCSGQSNMAQGIGISNNAKEEISSGNYPNIRLFFLKRMIARTPEEIPNGEWKICSPDNLIGYGWAGFSAAGYYFGRELHKELNVPIGLIQTAWGGTFAQAWTSMEALSTFDYFDKDIAKFKDISKKMKDKTYNFQEEVAKWWDTSLKHEGDAEGWNKNDFNDDAWKEMSLPSNWEKSGLPGFDGLVLFRKTIELEDTWKDKEAILSLGPIDDADLTFVNGVKVGNTSGWNIKREYKIPAGILKAGKNVICTAVFDSGAGGGIHGKPEGMYLSATGKSVTPKIKLAGQWKYKKMQDKKAFATFPRQYNGNPNTVTVLYNGMVSPIIPSAIKGAIWYQGEANVNQPEIYRTLLPLLIKDWRSRFTSAEKDFPFGIVQLANYRNITQEPVEKGWAALREAQFMTVKNTPNTGLAVTLDIGETNDIHPKNKQDVGKRLAKWMLARVYGKTLVYSGPLYEKMEIEGDKIRLHFTHTGSGLQAKGGEPLKWFAIAGEDKKWVKADAVIDGDTVVVSSAEVKKPVAVRYAWANNPMGANLYNKEGLPASSFRTDDWPRK